MDGNGFFTNQIILYDDEEREIWRIYVRVDRVGNFLSSSAISTDYENDIEYHYEDGKLIE
jgi:hypothetical protein